MDDLSIIENIRSYREAAGVSKDQMARMLGVHRTTYYAIESGRTPIIREVLPKIAEILEVSIEQLLLGQDYMLMSAKVLEEKDSLKEQLDAMKNFYEEKIKVLMKENDLLRQMNDAQVLTIKRDNEMIEMLSRKN